MKLRYYIVIICLVFLLLYGGFWLENALCDHSDGICFSFVKSTFLDNRVTMNAFFLGMMFPIILLFMRIFYKKFPIKTALWKLCLHYFLIIFPLILPIMLFEIQRFLQYGYMEMGSEFGLLMVVLMVGFCILIANSLYFFVEMYQLLKTENAS